MMGTQSLARERGEPGAALAGEGRWAFRNAGREIAGEIGRAHV